jgi:uncharacterized membrane protein YjgN (DUF898 family)
MADNAQDTPNKQPELTRITYDGELSQIARIWLVNLGLFVVTLSLYRFWGRTRIRQYVWAHTSILGSRLEYTGTGKELFKGFCIILPVYIGLSVLSTIFPNANAGFFIGFTMIGLIATYSGLRYRITRTAWRSIAGDMNKLGYNSYQTIGIKRYFIDIISLGITIPRSQIIKWKNLVEHISIGGKKAQYYFDGEGLALSNFVTLLLGVIIAVIFFIVGNGMIAKMFNKSTSLSLEVYKHALFALSAFLAFMIYYAIRQYYVAELVRRKFSGIIIGSVRFYTYYTRMQFIDFKVSNMVILLCLFGLGGPFILHRKAQFFAHYMATSGSFDDVELSEMQNTKNVVAEGFLDSFGLDIGIFS